MIVDGYVRVSQVKDRGGERFISPTVQRDYIERWAKNHGALIGEVFEELDESGGRPDRPLLLEAVRRVEHGESGGLVVAHLDRFFRSVSHGLGAVERIRHAGGRFVAVTDGLDTSTETGQAALQFALIMAESHLDAVGRNWRHGATEARDGAAPRYFVWLTATSSLPAVRWIMAM